MPFKKNQKTQAKITKYFLETEKKIKDAILAYEKERRRFDKHQGESYLLPPYLDEFLTRVRGKRKKDEVVLAAISKFYTHKEMIDLVNAIYNECTT